MTGRPGQAARPLEPPSLDPPPATYVPFEGSEKLNRRHQRRRARASDGLRIHLLLMSLPRARPRSRRPRSTRAIARSAPAWSSSAAGTCRSSTPASSTSTWRCGRAPGCSTSATWARSRSPAPTRSTAVQHITSNDAAKLADRPDPVLRADDAAGHVRGRRADLQAGRRALHARRQRVEHHQGLPLDCRARQGHAATPSPSTPARATR